MGPSPDWLGFGGWVLAWGILYHLTYQWEPRNKRWLVKSKRSAQTKPELRPLSLGVALLKPSARGRDGGRAGGQDFP